MIPEVAAVVAAAGKVVDSMPGFSVRTEALTELTEAVEALRMRASRPAGAVTHEETDRTWGEVCAEDEILSVKTGRFYEVRNTVRLPDGKIKVNIKGSLKPIIRPADESIRVKRGVLGDAADTLELLWSGVHTLGAVTKAESQEAGPMIRSTEEEDESDG